MKEHNVLVCLIHTFIATVILRKHYGWYWQNLLKSSYTSEGEIPLSQATWCVTTAQASLSQGRHISKLHIATFNQTAQTDTWEWHAKSNTALTKWSFSKQIIKHSRKSQNAENAFSEHA